MKFSHLIPSFTERTKKLLNPSFATLWIILAILFLSPIIVDPTGIIPFALTKSVVIYIGLSLAFALFVVSLLRSGSLTLPLEYTFVPLGFLLVVYSVSAVFSPSPVSAFVGTLAGTQTVLFLFAMIAALMLVFFLFQDKNRIFYSYLIFFSAAFVIALFQVIKLLLGDSVSFGILSPQTANLIGTWNDFGILMGAVVLLSLVTLEMLPMGRLFKSVLYVVLGLSFVFLILVNFWLVWFLLSLFTFVFFVYIFSLNKTHARNKDGAGAHGASGTSTSYFLTLVVLGLSVLFLASRELGVYISTLFDVYQPYFFPWKESFMVAQEAIKSSPLLGIGPNQYDVQWLQYKPQSFNQTLFWYLDFNSAGGFILTSLVTTGVLGFLAWIVFLGLFVWTGVRTVFAEVKGSALRYLTTSSFLVALFFWIIAFFYSPGSVILFLTFFFTGIFFASASMVGVLRIKTFALFKSSRLSFLVVMLLVLLFIGAGIFMYFSLKSTVAAARYQQGVAHFNATGNFGEAENMLLGAAALRPHDEYYRALVQLSLIRINTLLNTDVDDRGLEDAQRELISIVNRAEIYANNAIGYDSSEYRNWVALGRVYHTLAPLGAPAAYDNALAAYQGAMKRNPTNPAIVLTQAQLEQVMGNTEQARTFALQALEMKSNYTEAHFVLAQLAIQDGNVAQAIEALRTATITDSSNPALFFQLGVLHYNNEDWVSAISSLQRAIALLDGNYGNARYFLGLSLARSGDRLGAVEQFTILERDNPRNQEVQQILSNIRLDRDPLEGIEPLPEERDGLPIESEDQETADLTSEIETSTTTPETLEE